MSGVWLFALLNPAIGAVFTLVFLVLWLNQRQRFYILLIAGAALSYTLAFFVYVAVMPRGPGGHALVASALYLLSAGLFIEACLMRVGVRGNRGVMSAVSGVVLALIAYSLYVQTSVETRVLLLSGGMGTMFCLGAFRLRRATVRKQIDRVVFWLMLLAGLHFLPRTLLTLMADGAYLTPIDGSGRSFYWSMANFSMVLLSLVICLTMLFAIADDIIDDLKTDRNRDGMTSLLNRRGFEEKAQALLAKPHAGPCCLVFCDIDHFKSVNDQFGHAAGDEVIRRIGSSLDQATRPRDIAGRIGGEEFALLLTDTSRDKAIVICERLRAQVEAAQFVGVLDGATVTVSFGVSETTHDEPLSDAMRRADERLYCAKRNGRNRVEG